MYRREKFAREDRYKPEIKNPSFSSTLLDEIYRSIDEGDNKTQDLKFYRDSISKKQNKYSRVTEEEKANEKISVIPHSSLIEKYKVTQKDYTQQTRQYMRELEKRSQIYHDLDQDTMLFSSTSTSSDSSSGGFSSSDTDSMFGSRSVASSFAPPRPKPVRTNVAAPKEKTSSSLFYKQRELQMIEDYHYNSAPDNTLRLDDNLIKSKSRALKIYSNLKKVKQPISPGGKLANFINSLFTNGNTKKSKNHSSSPPTSFTNYDEERKLKSGQASTCSSASSFSRSCLSKHSPSTREKLRNGVKRTVTFYPVSVIVDEDCRPSGHKFLYQQEEDSNMMSVSLPTAWKIGKLTSRRVHDEVNNQVSDKSRKVEEFAREVLKDYHLNVKKSELIMRDVRRDYNSNYMEDEEDDDAASCSSSDLFELDHLEVMGNNRYCEELPVYETTHVHTNRAIANGLHV